MTTPSPPRLPDALAILDEWGEEFGLKVRLSGDTHAIQWQAGRLEERQRDQLRARKEHFTQALRWRAGLCIRCGGDPAKRPALNPKMPLLWCDHCYERGAWEEWSWGVPVKRGPVAGNADREAERAEEDARLFAGIGDDDGDREGPPSCLSF